MIVYKMRLDLQSDRTEHTDIVLTSGDVKAYRLEFSFFSNGLRSDVSGYALCIRAKRADGVLVIDSGEITQDGKGVYDIKSNIYQVPGQLTLEVALATEDGCYVTTKELIMTVRQGYGSAGLSAGNTTPILARLVEQSAKAEQAALAANRLAEMEFSAEQLPCGSVPTVEKTEENGSVSLKFGIPEGKQGTAPVKGVDYWTEEDKAELVRDVLAELPDGDEVSY